MQTCFGRSVCILSNPLAVSKIDASVIDMSDSPQTPSNNNAVGSPTTTKDHKFLIPSPIPTRRSRTYSASEKALAGPTYKGKVEEFCRQKGHGFIKPEDGGAHIFVHISDIDGEFVPKEGDDVTYKQCLIPPKSEKYQAVHVRITNLAPGTIHEMWDSPMSSPTMSPRS
ncbi:hypothetical protein ScPMuIL_004051 [Solemya velum]